MLKIFPENQSREGTDRGLILEVLKSQESPNSGLRNGIRRIRNSKITKQKIPVNPIMARNLKKIGQFSGKITEAAVCNATMWRI